MIRTWLEQKLCHGLRYGVGRWFPAWGPSFSTPGHHIWRWDGRCRGGRRRRGNQEVRPGGWAGDGSVTSHVETVGPGPHALGSWDAMWIFHRDKYGFTPRNGGFIKHGNGVQKLKSPQAMIGFSDEKQVLNSIGKVYCHKRGWTNKHGGVGPNQKKDPTQPKEESVSKLAGPQRFTQLSCRFHLLLWFLFGIIYFAYNQYRAVARCVYIYILLYDIFIFAARGRTVSPHFDVLDVVFFSMFSNVFSFYKSLLVGISSKNLKHTHDATLWTCSRKL